MEFHGPATVIQMPGVQGLFIGCVSASLNTVDVVICTHCLLWPPQATDWPIRHRNYGWPDSATIDHVVNNGCDVVQVAHRQCRRDEWMSNHQWRLSFSRAEIVLINSWIPVQQIIYHMLGLRCFTKTQRLPDIRDSDCNSGNSDFRISGNSVFFPSPEIPEFFKQKFRKFVTSIFLHYLL